MIELRAVVKGRVQGVRFRDYAQQAAGKLELVGYVKNLPDGNVEVVAQGAPDDLKFFVEHLYEGSVLSRVEEVTLEWGTVCTTYHDFSAL